MLLPARLAKRRRPIRVSRARTLTGPAGRAACSRARLGGLLPWLRVFLGWAQPGLRAPARRWWARGGRLGGVARVIYFRVHRGRRWRVLWVTSWHVGRSWGAFARSRRAVAYRRRIVAKKAQRKETLASRRTGRQAYVRPGTQAQRPSSVRERTARARAARATVALE